MLSAYILGVQLEIINLKFTSSKIDGLFLLLFSFSLLNIRQVKLCHYAREENRAN